MRIQGTRALGPRCFERRRELAVLPLLNSAPSGIEKRHVFRPSLPISHLRRSVSLHLRRRKFVSWDLPAHRLCILGPHYPFPALLHEEIWNCYGNPKVLNHQERASNIFTRLSCKKQHYLPGICFKKFTSPQRHSLFRKPIERFSIL